MTNPSFQASQQAQQAAAQASARAAYQASMDSMRASSAASDAHRRFVAAGPRHTPRPARQGWGVVGALFKLIFFLIWLAVGAWLLGFDATAIADW
ncbi:MAG: hypothetical protein ACRDT6_09410 [Micromonosporaceae bacterium]